VEIKSVTVKFGRTVNTGNFNSERYDAEITADVDEDVDKAFIVLTVMARKKVSNEIAYREEMRKVDRYLAGRPSEESLKKVLKRLSANEVLSERDKEIYSEEITVTLRKELARCP